MSHPTVSSKEFYSRYFGQLKGATITDVALLDDEEGFYVWPTFKATLHDGSEVTLELSQDEEGNGPGFLFGLPSPNQRRRPITRC